MEGLILTSAKLPGKPLCKEAPAQKALPNCLNDDAASIGSEGRSLRCSSELPSLSSLLLNSCWHRSSLSRTSCRRSLCRITAHPANPCRCRVGRNHVPHPCSQRARGCNPECQPLPELPNLDLGARAWVVRANVPWVLPNFIGCNSNRSCLLQATEEVAPIFKGGKPLQNGWT